MGIRRAARAHRLLVAAAMVLLWDVGSGNLLHEAVQKGDLEGVRELLERTDRNGLIQDCECWFWAGAAKFARLMTPTAVA